MVKNITLLSILLISMYTLSYGSSLSTEKIKIEDVFQKSRNAYEGIDIYASLFGKRSNINDIINYFGLEPSSFQNYRGDMISASGSKGEVVVDTRINSHQTKKSLKNFFLNSIQPYWSLKKDENGKLKIYYPFSVKSSGNIQVSKVHRNFDFYVGDDIPKTRVKNYWFTSRNWTRYYNLNYWDGKNWVSLLDNPYIYFSPTKGEIPNKTITVIKSYWVKSPVSVSKVTTSIKCQNGATYNPVKARCESYTSDACSPGFTYIYSLDKCRKQYYTSQKVNYIHYKVKQFDHWEYRIKNERVYERYIQPAIKIQHIKPDIVPPKIRLSEEYAGQPEVYSTCKKEKVKRECLSYPATRIKAQCQNIVVDTNKSCYLVDSSGNVFYKEDPSKCGKDEYCFLDIVVGIYCRKIVGKRCFPEKWTCHPDFPGPDSPYYCPKNDPYGTHKCYVGRVTTTCVYGYELKRRCTIKGTTYKYGACYRTVTKYDCPSGYILKDKKCYINKKEKTYTYKCPSGTYLKGEKCYKKIIKYYCPSGYIDNEIDCKKAVYKTVTKTKVTYYCPSGYNKLGNQCVKNIYKTPNCYGKKMPVYPYYLTPYYGHNGVCYSDAGLYCKTHGVSWDGRYRCFDYKYYCDPSRSWNWSTYSGRKYKISGGYHLETRQGLCVKYLFSCPVDKGHLYGRKEHPVYSDPSVLLKQLGSSVDSRMDKVASTLIIQDVVKQDEKGSLCAKIGYSRLKQDKNAQTYTIDNTKVKGF